MGSNETSLDIIEERFAKGEISEEEFEKMKKTLKMRIMFLLITKPLAQQNPFWDNCGHFTR